MSKPVIGILAHRSGNRFMNTRFLRDLVNAGSRLDANVYVFSHMDLNEKDRVIRGFTPLPNGDWKPANCTWPDVVIDFCRKLYKPFRDMRRRDDLFPYANHKFTYKWKAMEIFTAASELKRWIPETHLYTPERLERMLAKYPIVYVKPGNGTGGHSVMKIKRLKDTFLLQGRQRSGRLLKANLHSKRAVAVMLDRWVESERIRSGRFMVQQGLNLQLLPDRLVDVRLLIQKNGCGEWEVTGKVLRAGGKDSPTTNLIYGDGKAIRFHAFLESRFGRQKAKEIDEECNLLALRLVEVVEKQFGSMIEFGLDIGIDVDGRVWLIEVNPKPSHDAFLKSNERDIYLTSVLRPIEYAVYLAKNQTNEERHREAPEPEDKSEVELVELESV